MSDTKRNYIIDIIKVVLLLFVVIIHNDFSDKEILAYGFPFYFRLAVPTFLLLMSYALSMSFERRNIDSFKKAYDLKYLLSRYIRFLVPYLIVVLLEIVFRYFYMNYEFSIRDSIYTLIAGGYGQGGYYNALIFQLILLFPLIYFLVKKRGIYGVIDCFFINLLYEVIQASYMMNDTFYRLIVFRYIFVLSMGVFLYLSKKEFKPLVLIISFIIGVLYVFLVDYTSFDPIFVKKWKDTSLFFGFYVIPIVYLLLRINIKKLKLIPIISNASYDIFLMQMLIYYVINSLNIKFTDSRAINIIIMIFATFILGIVFNKIEVLIVKTITRQIDKIKIKKTNKIEKILFNG